MDIQTFDEDEFTLFQVNYFCLKLNNNKNRFSVGIAIKVLIS